MKRRFSPLPALLLSALLLGSTAPQSFAADPADSDGLTENGEDAEETPEAGGNSSSGGNAGGEDGSASATGYILTPWEEEDIAIPGAPDYYSARLQLMPGASSESLASAIPAARDTSPAAAAFPASFDGDWLGYFRDNYPPNRNQNPYGTCWSFSTNGLAEFYLISHGLADKSVDFSELHTVYWTYNQGTASPAGDTGDTIRLTDPLRRMPGGSLTYSVQTLMRQRGFVSENVLPYSEAREVESGTPAEPDTERQDSAWLKNASYIGIKSNPALIKGAILQNGAVGVSFQSNRSYYDRDHNSYYYPTESGTNHAVMAVGWDDNFPAEAFGSEAPGDGAWLIRNSWSTQVSADYDSYFWLSYYDASLKGAWVLEADLQPYDRNYYYDSQMHGVSSLNYGQSSKVWNANIFRAVGPSGADTETIEAVSFEVPGSMKNGTDYVVSVYTNLSDPLDPLSGGLKARVSGTIWFQGSYTIPLPCPVTVRKDSLFSVVVRCADSRTLVLEQSANAKSWDFIDSSVNAQPGQSFCSPDGTHWTDVGSRFKANLVISALANDRPRLQTRSALSPVPDTDLDELWLVKGQRFTLPKGEAFQSSDASVIKATASGSVKAVKEGSTTLRRKDGSSCTAHVVTPVLSASKLRLSPGETAELGMSLSFGGNDVSDLYPVLFTSSKPEVAVYEDGHVRAVAAGSTSISAYVNGKAFSCKVTVTAAPAVSAKSAESSLNMAPLQKLTLRIPGVSAKKRSWSSDHEMKEKTESGKLFYEDDVVRIDAAKGQILAIGCGSTTIRSDNGICLSITVSEPEEQVLYLTPGSRKTLKFYQLSNKNASWQTEDASVATVDAKGIVRGVAVGQTLIRCEYKGFHYSALVYVEAFRLAPAEGLVQTKEGRYTLNMLVGGTVRLSFLENENYRVRHNAENHSEIFFLSRNPSTAHADENGTVYALSPGSTSLKLRTGGRDIVIKVKVE
ncbi:MAG: Ig-like domain-containing protein [Lachnospiraceae bacterium]|nr:Ig-like domain-containing protein [Lachnospiraceae bacterium]